VRKFRCPHCGEKTFTYFDRIGGQLTGGGRMRYRRYDRMACHKCGGLCTTFVSSAAVFVLLVILLILSLATIVVGLVLKSPIAVWLCVAIWVCIGIYFITEVFVNPLVGIELDDSNTIFGTRNYKEANAKVSVNSARDIKAYRIYGIKFDNETKNAKFHERFRDGLVPAVFHEKKKGSNAFEVRIIGKKFVPEELLHIGSEFLVEDNDQFICRGTVTEIFSDVE